MTFNIPQGDSPSESSSGLLGRGDSAGTLTLVAGANVRNAAYAGGARGDGKTDDTGAFLAAVAAGVGAVIVPPGNYVIDGLALPSGAILQGLTGLSYYGAVPTVPAPDLVSRLILKSSSSSPLLSPDDSGSIRATAVRIRDLMLDCNGVAQPAISIPDQNSSIPRFWNIERCYIRNIGGSTGYGVYVGHFNTGCLMRDCVVFNGTSGSRAGWNGVGWYGSDGLMDHCFIGYFANVGLYVLGGSSDVTFVVRDSGIFTNSTGIVCGGGGIVITGSSVDHNYNDGIYIGNSPVNITDTTFHSNSRDADNTWAHVNIAADDLQVTVKGCRIAPRDSDAGGNDPAYFIRAGMSTGVILNQHGNVLESGARLATGWTDYDGAVSAPPFPRSGQASTNKTGADIQAFVANSSGDITSIMLGSTTTGMTIAAHNSMAIRISNGQGITFTYDSGKPSWTWVIG